MIENLKQYYKDMAIRKKIIVVFAASFIVFIALILVVANVILYHSNIVRSEQNIQDECDMVDWQIDSLYANLEVCQNSAIQGINQVYENTENQELDTVSFVSIKNNLYNILNYYQSCFEEVDSLVFMDMEGNIVSTGLDQTPRAKDLSELTAEIPDYGPVNTITFPVERREYFGGDEKNGILTQGKRVLHIDSGNNLGYLFVNAKTGTIADLFPTGDEVMRKRYYLADQSGRIQVVKEPELLLTDMDTSFLEQVREYGQDSFQTNLQNETVLVTSRENDSFGWTLISEVPVQDIVKDVYTMTVTIAGLGFLCIFLVMGLILIFSKVITNPIKALTNTAKSIAEGKLSCRCIVDRKDEVGILSKTFNGMVERVENLLIQVKKEQKEKREAELALFQAQIKPHFLYNTLDLIYVCCEMDEGKVGGKIAKALADYYHTCLSGGEEVVSIGEEIRNIENYLFIQKERYSDILTYQIEVPDNLKNYKIPKLTLQPLVENAIYHGLKEKDGEGTITITVEEEENSIALRVSDDGVGMADGDFEKILKKKDEKEKRHFGLKNVHQRLKLYFGEEYGLFMEPEQTSGTCIKVWIPKVEAYYD